MNSGVTVVAGASVTVVVCGPWGSAEAVVCGTWGNAVMVDEKPGTGVFGSLSVNTEVWAKAPAAKAAMRVIGNMMSMNVSLSFS